MHLHLHLYTTHIGAGVLSPLSNQDVKLLALLQQKVSRDVDAVRSFNGHHASTAGCTVSCDPAHTRTQGNVSRQQDKREIEEIN